MTHKTLLAALCLLTAAAQAQTALQLRQQSLAQWEIPAGNYSGIAPLGDGRYAVVSDKEPMDGFFIWQIQQDSLSGEVQSVRLEGWRGQALQNRDAEGIAYFPPAGTLFISGEADQQIREYTLEGALTGRMLDVPTAFDAAHIYANYGFEALTYDPQAARFYTITESTLRDDGKPSGPLNPAAQNALRLQAFTDDGAAAEQYLYFQDAPQTRKYGSTYVFGVVALTPSPGGGLLVLEREANVPKAYIGARVWNKIYRISPADAQPIDAAAPLPAAETALPKTLVAEWETSLNVSKRSWANYEGMCLGRRLADGRQTLLLVSDSQGGYGKGPVHLQDFIKVLVRPD